MICNGLATSVEPCYLYDCITHTQSRYCSKLCACFAWCPISRNWRCFHTSQWPERLPGVLHYWLDDSDGILPKGDAIKLCSANVQGCLDDLTRGLVYCMTSSNARYTGLCAPGMPWPRHRPCSSGSSPGQTS